jgi:hypothetical protein
VNSSVTRLRLIVVVALGLLLLLLAPAAGAASRTQIIRDCEDDSKLSGSYTTGELRDARNNLPSDKDAYSDCRDVLSAALAAAARAKANPGGGDGGGGGGAAGGAPSTDDPRLAPGGLSTRPGAPKPEVSPEEEKALTEARTQLPSVNVHGQKVVPGVNGVAGDTAAATIPAPLAVVLVVLALTAALAAASVARRRVLARRPA